MTDSLSPPRDQTPDSIQVPADDDLQSLAFLARSLGDGNRLRILFALAAEKKAVSRLVEELGLSQPLVSHHLKELRRALLVRVERNGPFIYYEIADPRILDIAGRLRSLAVDLLAARSSF
ncbi:MAG: ArsR/SmtB-type metalloregulator TsoR [Thermodesulfobacteriota bacterium]